MIKFIRLASSYLVMLGLVTVGAVWSLGFATDVIAHRYIKSVQNGIHSVGR